MSVLKKYNEGTSQWEAVVVGKQGNSGVVSVTSPITNSGTSTSAVLGIDSSALLPDVAGKNKIINGGFDFWQRGTSFTFGAAGWVADRWRYDVASAIPSGTVSQQTFTPGTAPVVGYEGTYFERFNITAHNGCTNVTHETRIEDVRTFAGQTVTFSAWIKADAATTINAVINQNFGSGGSGQVGITAMAAQAITSSWVRYTATVSIPSIAGKTIGAGSYLGVVFVLPVSGANVRVGSTDIWGVQLEAGSVATPFSRAAGTLQGELAACQRYYYRFAASQGGTFCQAFTASWESSTAAWGVFPLPVPMRTNPTFSYGGTWNTNYGGIGTIVLDTNQTTPSRAGLGWNTGSGGANGYSVYVRASNNTASYMEFSAEL